MNIISTSILKIKIKKYVETQGFLSKSIFIIKIKIVLKLRLFG